MLCEWLVTDTRRAPRIGVLTHVRTLEPVMIADLDTLLTRFRE